MNSLVSFFTSVFSGISKELTVFFISLMPLLELRGGLIASSLLNLDWKTAFPICVLGNILPIPFILIFINKVFSLLKKTKLNRFVIFFEERAKIKSEKILKYKELGLFAFVALPLPGTGGWMGALIAALMCLDIKKSTFIITLGIITAGTIMSLLSYFAPFVLRSSFS